MKENTFEIKDVLIYAWEGFTKNALLLIVLPLGLVVVSGMIYAFAMFFIVLIPFLIFLLPVLILVELLISIYIMLSMTKAVLSIIKGETPSWEVLKNDPMTFIKFTAVFIIIGFASAVIATVISTFFSIALGSGILYLLIIGLSLMVVSIAVITLFFPAQFIISDKKDAEIIGSIKKSLNLTLPQFVQCLIFVIVCFVINFVGTIPFGLGLIITVPVSIIAAAIVYRKLDGSSADTSVIIETETTPS